MKMSLIPRILLASCVVAGGEVIAGASWSKETRADAMTSRADGPLTIGPFAYAAATSEVAHRVFVASSYMDNRNGGVTGTGRLSILDGRTGQLLHRVVVGRGADDVAVDDRTGHVFVAGRGDMTWYRQGNLNLYRRSNAGLTMVEMSSGRVLSQINWGEQAPGTMVLSTSTARLFVITARVTGNAAPTVHAIDTRTGKQLWSRPGRGVENTATVLTSIPRVFTLGKGSVQMRDARTWRLLKTVSLGAVAIAPNNSHSRLAVLMRNGRAVGVLDGRTGRLLRSVSLSGGHVGGQLVADDKTGHVFVISQPSYKGTGSPQGGWIMTIDVAAGRVVRTVGVGSTTGAAAVDRSAGRMLVLSGWSADSGRHSKLTLIDTRTGRLVRNIPLFTWLPFSSLTVSAGTTRGFVTGAQRNISRPRSADVMKSANSVVVVNSRSGVLVRTVNLSPGSRS